MRGIGKYIRRHWGLLLMEFLTLAGCLIILAPMCIMFLGAAKNTREANQAQLSLPTEWHFENFQIVFEKGNVGRAYANSLLISLGTVVLTITLSSGAGFYIARRDSRFSKTSYYIFLIGLIAPMTMITLIRLLQIFGLVNTLTGLILVFAAGSIPFSVFLFTGFVKNIPRELDEAAIIDGCKSFQLFYRIILPLLTPVVATNFIIVFMNAWNSFVTPLYLLKTSAKWPMPLTVYGFFGRFISQWNLVFANLTLTALPILIVYLIGQKYIISGMTAGAIKG